MPTGLGQTLQTEHKMQLSSEGMGGTYLEEAAQCARGSVLSVEERKSEAKRREAVGD